MLKNTGIQTRTGFLNEYCTACRLPCDNKSVDIIATGKCDEYITCFILAEANDYHVR